VLLDFGAGPSCGAAEALEQQEPFGNPALAKHTLTLLAWLFRRGAIAYHAAFVNVGDRRMQPIAVNRAVWGQWRRRANGRTRMLLTQIIAWTWVVC
jgi:hypothetical protein